MYKIVLKRQLNEQVTLMDIDAPYIARKAEAGQFIILRVREGGERIPLTIAGYDRNKGTITIIFQAVGKTTDLLAKLNEGEDILDVVGPLGVPTHLDGYKNVAVLGGGLGTAIAYPQVKKLAELGAKVYAIAGFRNKDLIILEDELKKVCDDVTISTDDGSNGNKGFVTDILKQKMTEIELDLVIAIGPLPMMHAVAELTRQTGVKTLVSMNPIMIDGTGMCGGCRVTVGGETKFACVDGPDFDGHLVDFKEAMRRNGIYKEEEHACRMEAMTGE